VKNRGVLSSVRGAMWKERAAPGSLQVNHFLREKGGDPLQLKAPKRKVSSESKHVVPSSCSIEKKGKGISMNNGKGETTKKEKKLDG